MDAPLSIMCLADILGPLIWDSTLPYFPKAPQAAGYLFTVLGEVSSVSCPRLHSAIKNALLSPLPITLVQIQGPSLLVRQSSWHSSVHFHFF